MQDSEQPPRPNADSLRPPRAPAHRGPGDKPQRNHTRHSAPGTTKRRRWAAQNQFPTPTPGAEGAAARRRPPNPHPWRAAAPTARSVATPAYVGGPTGIGTPTSQAPDQLQRPTSSAPPRPRANPDMNRCNQSGHDGQSLRQCGEDRDRGLIQRAPKTCSALMFALHVHPTRDRLFQ